MHDANGQELKKGDKVIIIAEITELYPTEEYCNVTVKTTLDRRPDGVKETMTLNTGVMVKARPMDGMTFGMAIEELKKGKRVCRQGWNGKGMWLVMQRPDAHSKMTLPYIYIEYPEGHIAYPNGSRVPWLASQTDMLAEDYIIVE